MTNTIQAPDFEAIKQRRIEIGAEATVARYIFNARTAFAQGVGEQFPPAVAAEDEHAAAGDGFSRKFRQCDHRLAVGAAVAQFGYSALHRRSFRPPTLFDTMD